MVRSGGCSCSCKIVMLPSPAAGTQPGKVLRLRGKGLPNINSYGYSTGTGDLLVNVSVYIPETLTKEERQAMEKWQESESFKPNTSLKEKIFKKFRSLFD